MALQKTVTDPRTGVVITNAYVALLHRWEGFYKKDVRLTYGVFTSSTHATNYKTAVQAGEDTEGVEPIYTFDIRAEDTDYDNFLKYTVVSPESKNQVSNGYDFIKTKEGWADALDV